MPLASSLLSAGGFPLTAFASAGLFAVATGQAQTSVPVKPEAAMIHLAAGALGGERRILALRTLIIEGTGTNPNVGQNRNPDDPLPDWEVTDYRKVIDLVRERM